MDEQTPPTEKESVTNVPRLMMIIGVIALVILVVWGLITILVTHTVTFVFLVAIAIIGIGFDLLNEKAGWL